MNSRLRNKLFLNYDKTKLVGDEYNSREFLDKIFTAIIQLSDNPKAAIILLKTEDKSQTEAAEIMK